MDPNNIVSEVSKKIDSIKYTESPKSLEVSDEITIGWKTVLPEPPKNTSAITLKELRFLSQITQRLTEEQVSLVMLVDKDPLDLFMPFLEEKNLSFDRQEFRDLFYKTFDPVITNLKGIYNRPRPEQLAPHFGIKINILETDSHHTPAYPSGHTAYAAFAAYQMAAMYPQYSSYFFRRIGLAGYARCLQGVHYPSDNDASMVISGALWENVKYNLFPDLFPEKVG